MNVEATNTETIQNTLSFKNLHKKQPNVSKILKELNNHTKIENISSIIVSFIIFNVEIARQNKNPIVLQYVSTLPAYKVSDMFCDPFANYNRECTLLQLTPNGTATKLYTLSTNYTIFSSIDCILECNRETNKQNIFAVPSKHALVQIIRSSSDRQTAYIICPKIRGRWWFKRKGISLKPLQEVLRKKYQVIYKEFEAQHSIVNHSRTNNTNSNDQGDATGVN